MINEILDISTIKVSEEVIEKTKIIYPDLIKIPVPPIPDFYMTINQPERSKREDLTSISPLPNGLAERLWKMGDR